MANRIPANGGSGETRLRGGEDARAVLFDFDGTLFDASDAIVFSFNAALRATGRPEWPRMRIAPLIGRPLLEMFPLAAPGASPDEVDRLIAIYREAFLPVSIRLTRALPGMAPCIGQLRRSGFRLAIVTNRAGHGARHILSGFNMAEAFPVVIGIDDVARTKPDPEPLQRALAQLEVGPDAAVMVGDTGEDMRAAVAAGVRGIGVLTGTCGEAALRKAGASAIVPDLTHLCHALGDAPPG